MDLIDGIHSIRAVSVGDGGICLASIVAEQEHLLAVKGVFRPGDVRQRADCLGTARVIGVLTVDEIDLLALISGRNHRRESIHTDSIRADVVTGETIELGKLSNMNRAKVEEVLPTLPH